MNNIDYEKLLNECRYNFSRSGGKGGQNVNKVETKVELIFDLVNSQTLSDDIKEKLRVKLSNRIKTDGTLSVTSQTERTQLGNKKKAEARFIKLIDAALIPEKKRHRTKPTVTSKLKRLETKKKLSEKKKSRNLKNYLD